MEELSKYWQIIATSIGAVVWFVRLEGRAKANARDFARFEARYERQRSEDIANRNRDWEAINKRLDTIDSNILKILQNLN